ncbi:MAG TPA: lysozyme [Alphaproteobacteria bacterium]|nr:lysozyme [Alphaproteobacteria bacterium]
MRAINKAGLALIKSHEGLSLKAYRSPAGDLTIGYGHTNEVEEGETITAEQAEQLLQDDLQNFEAGVERLVTVALNDNQFAALVSFAFNIGLGAFARSTLLSLLNRGWYEQVPAQILRWSRAAGKRLAGLARRRRDEAALWSTPVKE